MVQLFNGTIIQWYNTLINNSQQFVNVKTITI